MWHIRWLLLKHRFSTKFIIAKGECIERTYILYSCRINYTCFLKIRPNSICVFVIGLISGVEGFSRAPGDSHAPSPHPSTGIGGNNPNRKNETVLQFKKMSTPQIFAAPSVNGLLAHFYS